MNPASFCFFLSILQPEFLYLVSCPAARSTKIIFCPDAGRICRVFFVMNGESMDRFTLRGICYATLSGLGLGYELFFVPQPRLFLLVMYSIVVIVGMVLIFFVHETEDELPNLWS